MSKQILFIQGGGDDGYKVDEEFVKSLEKNLGEAYEIKYPNIKSDESKPAYGWLEQISKQVDLMNDNFYLVAHSFGASMVLKYLSENKIDKKIAGIFLIATPVWNGDEEWQKALQLKDDFADKLENEIPLFFYHNKDDEEVPFKQLSFYKEHIKHAIFREQEKGGHQFDNDLSVVAKDITSL